MIATDNSNPSTGLPSTGRKPWSKPKAAAVKVKSVTENGGGGGTDRGCVS